MDKITKPFKSRLKEALDYREMRPVDLCNKTKISQSTMSQYLSGYAEPKKKRLSLIADALNVNPTWLMGLNVPMEQTEEDLNILKRDYILQDIDNILKAAGYTLVCESYDDDYFTVKNSSGQTTASFYDYELLARYDSLKRKGKLTAELLLSSDSAFIKYLESLGYYIQNDDPEHKPFMTFHQLTVRLEYDTIEKLKSQIDKYTLATVDSKLLSLKEKELREERLEKERTLQHLQGENIYKGSLFESDFNKYHSTRTVNAAHARTDIDIPEGTNTSDDDIMDDENF